jgi:hypothetical protein
VIQYWPQEDKSMKTPAIVIASLLAVFVVSASSYSCGYKTGAAAKEKEHAIEVVNAVTKQIDTERKKQEELSALTVSLSSDNERLNRVLKSKSSAPADLNTCVVERDRLRELVKEGAALVTECRKGLGWCEIQLKK